MCKIVPIAYQSYPSPKFITIYRIIFKFLHLSNNNINFYTVLISVFILTTPLNIKPQSTMGQYY